MGLGGGGKRRGICEYSQFIISVPLKQWLISSAPSASPPPAQWPLSFQWHPFPLCSPHTINTISVLLYPPQSDGNRNECAGSSTRKSVVCVTRQTISWRMKSGTGLPKHWELHDRGWVKTSKSASLYSLRVNEKLCVYTDSLLTPISLTPKVELQCSRFSRCTWVPKMVVKANLTMIVIPLTRPRNLKK